MTANSAGRVVRSISDRVVEFGGEPHSGWLPDGAATPSCTPEVSVALNLWIIEESSESFLLEWHARDSDRHPDYWGDTWHSSLADALEQAERAFGIDPGEWQFHASSH